MILDRVSYYAFIHLCRVILSHMVHPTVVILHLTGHFTVSRRLSTPLPCVSLCFSFNAALLIQ